MDYLLIGLSILPVVVLMIFIYFQDKYQKEPIKLLAKAFIGGMLAIPLDFVVIDLIKLVFYSESTAYQAFFEAGIPEELSKFIILFLFIWRRKEFDEYMDGIVYAAFVGLGFACVENLLYVSSSAAEAYQIAISTSFSRALVSVPGHFLFAVVMGYFFSLAKFDKKHRARNLILSVICAAAVHGLFDYMLMIEEFLSSGLATVIFIVFILGDIKLWKLGIKFIRKQQQLTQNQNITSEEEYAQAETPVTENEEPEYKSIDWNAGEKTTN